MSKKGSEKNTKNKARHKKVINHKKNKLIKEKNLRKTRLKTIIKKAKEQKAEKDNDNA